MHGGDSIMIWGSICGNDTSKLVEIEGIMSKNVYHNILVHHGNPLLNDSDWLWVHTIK